MVGKRSRAKLSSGDRCATTTIVRGFLASLVLFIFACGSTSGGPVPDTDPEWVINPPGPTSNAGELHMSVSREYLDADIEQSLEVHAQVLDPDGDPVVGQPVVFQVAVKDASFNPPLFFVEERIDLPRFQRGFPAGESITDGDGEAMVVLTMTPKPGDIPVTATVASLHVSDLRILRVR